MNAIQVANDSDAEQRSSVFVQRGGRRQCCGQRDGWFASTGADRDASRGLLYGIDREPPACLAAWLGLQNAVTTIGGTLFVINVLAPKLCIMREDPVQAYLLSTAVMMAGISTLFQLFLGVRLPIVHNSGFVYMICTLSILNLPKWQCPSQVDLYSMGPDDRTVEWQHRVREMQGAIITISFLQMLIGYGGFIGKVLKYITPLTVVPTMCIVGVSIVEKGICLMSGNWATAIITLFFLTLFSQYLRKIPVSIPVYWSKKGLILAQLKLFALFSILLSVGIMWIACFYMTSKNDLSPTDSANTESKSGVFRNVQMFRIPYPFQWGLPIFSLTSIIAMLPALFTSIVESVGNYYTCAKYSNLTLPQVSVINRGIGVQGITSILAGLLGIGSGVSASSENVGNIGITRVCSRNVIVYASFILIFVSPFTKIMALFVTLPDPVLGAVTAVLLTLITAVAISNLQFINLNSIRNMYILGMSMFFGLALPKYISTRTSFTYTNYEPMNDIIFVYMSSGMFIGGFIGFVLDNTIPADDNVSNKVAYYMTDDKSSKTPAEIEDEEVYAIPERLYDKIESCLMCCI